METAVQGKIPLPSPGVRFGDDFLGRVERLVARVRSARERREGSGKGSLQGVGAEFLGYRPYRPGENLRAVDWSLFARLDRPFVRVARREASERWAVLVDRSASMAVGRPGKLQAAAELATAIASLGLTVGASVELVLSPGAGAGRPRSLLLRKKVELPSWLAFLEEARAEGDRGVAALVQEPARFRGAGRVFVLGDLLDLEHDALFGLARRGRELLCAQLLAPEELTPSTAGDGELGRALVWVDAESGARHALELDARTRDRYEAVLRRRLERWRVACARHRVAFGTWSSATPFEDVCTGLFPG
ncbi:MAG: DUF58 domain-containing protein [Planctomycetota bacterium]